MSHRFRVSSGLQTATIEDALDVFNAMKEHLDFCGACCDEGLCPAAQVIQIQVDEARRQLKRIGIEWQVGTE